jgi:hypothetical protein
MKGNPMKKPLYPPSSFPLSPEELKRLDAMLIERNNVSVFKTDGFFCALHLFLEEDIRDGIPFLCGQSEWASPSEKEWVIQSLTTLFDHRKNQINTFYDPIIPLSLPVSFIPLVDYEPLTSLSGGEGLTDSQKTRLTEWCRGYLTALQRDEKTLRDLHKEEEADLLNGLIPVLVLARPDTEHFSEFLPYLNLYEEWDKVKKEWIGMDDNGLARQVTFSISYTCLVFLNKKQSLLDTIRHMCLKRFSYRRDEEKMGQTKVGRNTPCPCGSGKKFKRCCLHQIGAEEDKQDKDKSV